LELQQYDFEVAYRKGKLNVVAYALSRQPLNEDVCARVEVGKELAELVGTEGNWIQKMLQKIRKEPRKFPDYLEDAGNLYRHIPHRAGIHPGSCVCQRIRNNECYTRITT